MSQTIELESIRRLDIRAGETLVATLPANATLATLHEVKAKLQAELPNVKLLVVSHNVDLQVLCPSSPA